MSNGGAGRHCILNHEKLGTPAIITVGGVSERAYCACNKCDKRKIPYEKFKKSRSPIAKLLAAANLDTDKVISNDPGISVSA